MQALEGDTLTSEEKADLAVNVGRRLVRMGETTLTIELLTQVPPDTDNADVWFVLGRAYALEKEWAKSTLAYEQALAVDPQHYWANHLLAGNYASWGKWEAVVQLEQEALESAPSDRDRLNSGVRLVEAYEELGNRDNACAMLQQLETWAEKGDARVEDLRTRLTCQK
jgi:tetratricopeptide (TPR) repeat protein